MEHFSFLSTSYLNDDILHVELQRKERLNALSQELLLELLRLFKIVKHDEKIRAVLLTGAGKVFCAGADIKELSALESFSGYSYATMGQMVFQTLETLGKPSLAAIQGVALGGGLELAMAATLRICTHDAKFAQPEIKLGLIPGFGGTQRLSRLIGVGRALDLCLTGRQINSDDAKSWGLVSERMLPNKLIDHAVKILTDIKAYSREAIQGILTSIYTGYNLSLHEALTVEASQFGICCGTQNKTEGVNAFLEKRPPIFNRDEK